MARTATFRITRLGASHWGPPEGKARERKRYGFNDLIELPYDAGTDPKWNNLGLVFAGKNAEQATDVAAEEKELGQVPANETIKPAAGDIGTGDDKTKDDDKKDPRKAQVEALTAELETASGTAEINAVRAKVIEADLFEKDTVPTKKADLLDALKGYFEIE